MSPKPGTFFNAPLWPWRWFKSFSINTQFLSWTVLVLAIAGALGGGLIGNARQTLGEYCGSHRSERKQRNRGKNCSQYSEVVVECDAQIVLLGHVFNVDIPSRQVSISWLIIGCGGLQMPYTTTYGVTNCGRLAVGGELLCRWVSDRCLRRDRTND